MTLRLMLRSAAATVLLAGPLAAQAPDAVGPCDIAGMTPQAYAALDTDADGALTLDEFRACPGSAGFEPAPAQAGAFDVAFADADGDADGRLTLIEIERVDETDTAEAAPPSTLAQPQGTVTVTQPAPQVEVIQPAAEVDVTQPAPAVAVEAPAPTVAVQSAAPSVAVTPAAPPVEVAQDVPVPPAAAVPEPVAGSPAAEPAAAEGAAPADPTAGATASAPMPPDFRINVVDLDGKDVLNTAGDEIGSVADVLLDPRTDMPVVIVAVGGILGIGDREIPFPYSEFTITGEEVVLNSALTAEQIEDMPEYEKGSYEPLPDTMRVP